MSDDPSIPQISEAEWVVMREFWRLGRATSGEVIGQLQAQTVWKPKTIQTLIGRLVQKGALGYERNGREYIYWPLVSEKACEQEASESFLNHFFDGKLAPFLSAFVERKGLSESEVSELKKILESMDPGEEEAPRDDDDDA